MSEFDKVMSERSDFELFEIIHYQNDSYKPDALRSAEKEFNSRNIDSHDITEFKQKIQKAIVLKSEKENQKTELKKKAVEVGKLFLPTEKSTLSKTMLSLCIFLTVSFLFYLLRDFRMIVLFFSDVGDWDLSVIGFLFPFLLFPIGIYGLWKSKRYGWYLIVGLLTYFSFATAYSGISFYKYSMGDGGGIFEQLEGLFPRPSIASIIFRFIVLFGIVYFLNRTRILKIFNVKRTNGLVFVGAILLVSIAIWWRLI